MTTAYITCFKGCLTAESTLIIDGTEYPIPAETSRGSRYAEDRVREAVRDAGYRTSGGYYDALTDVDEHGGYTIELERL
jgi:hypothetical protein